MKVLGPSRALFPLTAPGSSCALEEAVRRRHAAENPLQPPEGPDPARLPRRAVCVLSSLLREARGLGTESPAGDWGQSPHHRREPYGSTPSVRGRGERRGVRVYPATRERSFPDACEGWVGGALPRATPGGMPPPWTPGPLSEDWKEP